MDSFLDMLIKRSDIEKNEYHNYRQPKAQKSQRPAITFREYPDADSYVVLDFETTGLDCHVNRIIEIGAIKVWDNNIVGTMNALVDPQQYIPAYISQKVHITNNMVSGKPTIEMLLPKLVELIGDLPVVAHNAGFDMGFLIAACRRQGIKFDNPAIDTLRLSRKYNKECSKHNLAYLTSFFGIELKNAHRAYFDAFATYKLYNIIKEKYLAL